MSDTTHNSTEISAEEKQSYMFTTTDKYGMEHTEQYKKVYSGDVSVKIAVTTSQKWVSFNIQLTPSEKEALDKKGEFTQDDIKGYEQEIEESEPGCIEHEFIGQVPDELKEVIEEYIEENGIQELEEDWWQECWDDEDDCEFKLVSGGFTFEN